MRHVYTRRHSNSVRTPVCTQSIAVTVVGLRRLRILYRAAHDLGEHARKAEADGRHAGADYANLDFEYGPETGFKVVP